MSGNRASGSKKSSKSSGILINGLRRTVEDESGVVLSADIRALRDSDRRYIKVGSSIILLTIMAASSIIAFSIYSLYFQFRLQGMGLKSIPYIAAIVISLAIGSASTCAVVYNSPRLVRIRKASEENRRALINCKEDLVRSIVATIEENVDIINRGKCCIKGICDEEETVIRKIDELHSAHELYSRVHELKKIRREAIDRCSKEAHDVVDAMRDDLSSALDYYGKLFNNRNIIRGNLREAMELVRRSLDKLRENRAVLAAKREEYRVVLVDLGIAGAKVNSFRAEKGEEYERALKTYNDKRQLSDMLCGEVDEIQVRVSELKRDIDFLNDDIQDMKMELESISEKMDSVDRSLSIREANVSSAIEFRDSISQDFMLEMVKLAEAFSSPWSTDVDQLSSVDNFFGITERKREIAEEIKNAREKSFKAYIELSSIFSETSSSIINGSEYLKAVKRRDFRSQMRDEWYGLDLPILQKEREIKEVATTRSASSEEEAGQDIMIIQEIEEGPEPSSWSEGRDVAKEAGVSTCFTTSVSTSSSAPASFASVEKHLITVENTDIKRKEATSYRSFFSWKKKESTAADDGGTEGPDDVTTRTTAPSTGSFFSWRKSTTAGSNVSDKEDVKVEGTFATWRRKYFAAARGSEEGAVPSPKPASSGKKAHPFEGHHIVKGVEDMVRKVLASGGLPGGMEGGNMVASNGKKKAAHILAEARAESVSLQQVNGKEA